MKRVILAVTAGTVLTTSACGGQKSAAESHSTIPTTPPVTTRSITSPAGTPTPTGPQAFSTQITKIPSRATLQYSWRPGCPVDISDLRLIRMPYWGIDKKTHDGEMVVNADVTGKVVKVFRTLYAMRFPIRSMDLIDKYGGDDDKSVHADNTSGFNCRKATGLSVWSQHAYGHAIDVNPCENPYVSNGVVDPLCNPMYGDRSRKLPGMIHNGDRVVNAFASVGWGWGGHWSDPKDYQHFSVTGY